MTTCTLSINEHPVPLSTIQTLNYDPRALPVRVMLLIVDHLQEISYVIYYMEMCLLLDLWAPFYGPDFTRVIKHLLASKYEWLPVYFEGWMDGR